MESDSPSTQPVSSRSRWVIHMMLITGYILLIGFLGAKRSSSHTAILSPSAGGLIAVSAVELLIFGVIFGLACFASRATRDELRLRWHGGVRPVIWGAAYSVSLRVGLGLIVMGVGMALTVTRVMSPEQLKEYVSSHRPGVEAIIDVAAMRNNPTYYWLTLTVVSFVVAGLREELWRSGFLAGMKALWPQYFGSRGGQVGAVMVCAIIFGFGHLAMGPLAAFLAGLIGVGLGLIMVFHGSIWPAVMAHGFFDATSMALLPWAMSHLTKAP